MRYSALSPGLVLISLLALVIPLSPIPASLPQPVSPALAFIQTRPDEDGPPGHEQAPIPVTANLPVPLSILGPEFSPRLPDLSPLPPTRLQIIFPGGAEKKLRFDTTFANLGEGPVELYGERVEGDNTTVAVTQAVRSARGGPLLVPMGEMIYHPVHVHWHWLDFAHYAIWSWLPQGGPDELLVDGEKVSFCLRDIHYVGPSGSPEGRRPAYDSCSWQQQGLSAGWTDLYERHLHGQSLDISDLPDGRYALVITVNPNHQIIESSLRNNQTYTVFSLIDGRLAPAE